MYYAHCEDIIEAMLQKKPSFESFIKSSLTTKITEFLHLWNSSCLPYYKHPNSCIMCTMLNSLIQWLPGVDMTTTTNNKKMPPGPFCRVLFPPVSLLHDVLGRFIFISGVDRCSMLWIFFLTFLTHLHNYACMHVHAP